jgi:hypothetical protein
MVFWEYFNVILMQLISIGISDAIEFQFTNSDVHMYHNCPDLARGSRQWCHEQYNAVDAFMTGIQCALLPLILQLGLLCAIHSCKYRDSDDNNGIKVSVDNGPKVETYHDLAWLKYVSVFNILSPFFFWPPMWRPFVGHFEAMFASHMALYTVNLAAFLLIHIV